MATPTLPDGPYADSGTLGEISVSVRDYLAFALLQGGPEPALVRALYSGYPKTFGRDFPAGVVQISGGRGRYGRGSRRRSTSAAGLPEWLDLTVDFYDLLGRAGASPADIADAITKAEDSCLAAYGSWRAAFDADIAFHDRFMDVDLPDYAMGATDRYGRSLTDAATDNYLWRLRSGVRLRL